MRLPVLSMRWKLVLASALVEVVMLTALVWNSMRLIEDSLQQQAGLRLSEVAGLLNTSIAPAMAAQDYAPIADAFRASRRQEGIQYFVLTDKNGRILLADGWNAATPPPPVQQQMDIHNINQRFDTSIPIVLAEQTYGQLHYGISTRFIVDARNHLIRQSFFIAAAEVALSILLLVLLGIWITRHLAQLRNASQSVAEGRYDIRLPVAARDEVGLLAATFNDMAERIQSQMNELQESEARFRSLAELSSDWYWEQDADFRFVHHNSGGHAASQINPSHQLHGKCRWELETTLTAAEMNAHRALNQAHQSFREFEYGTKCLDGRMRYFSVSGEPIFDASGIFTGYRGTAKDSTARKEAENRLRESERKLFNILEGVEAYIYIKDTNYHYQFANRHVRELFGASMDEIVGHPDDRFFDLATAANLRENDSRVLEGGETLRTEESNVVAATGERHTYWSIKLPLRDADGNIYALCGISTDITERIKAEAALRIAATVFESQEGMVITDAANKILQVNRTFTEITGYSADEVLGQKPSLLGSGHHDAAFYAMLWGCIERSGTWQGEIWNRRKNGELYPEWLTITAVKDKAGATTHYVGTFVDISQRKAAEDEIKHLAFYDSLTRLPNRRLLHDRLQQALAASARSLREGALLLIDLDNFKTLNDTLGHDKGDQLLQQVSQRLVACVRECDTVARLGGDEFVVMLEDLGDSPAEAASQTEIIGEKIIAALNQPYLLAEHDYQSTPSIGVTLFCGHRNSMDELLKQADLAMYQAKGAGRNTLRFFDAEMQAVVTASALLEADLRQGIQKNQFLLYYQPQVDGAGRITGAEALLRWQHPQRGLVPPAEFIPAAEMSGLILPLGHWVMQQACRQLVCWAARPATAHLTLAVNVSSRQFRQPDFVTQVLAVLDSTGANPYRLKLELTESLLLDDVEDIIDKMNVLKVQGVSFSLDDFGTGYSSLSYLKRLPLAQLKIDQSFVRDILTDPNDAVIARTIVALGQSLGLAVIAEGVETEAQRGFLASYGCHAYQGYLFSRPLPLENFDQLMLT